MKKINLTALFIIMTMFFFGQTQGDFYRKEPKLIKFETEDVKYGDATIFEDNRLIYYDRTNRVTTRHKIVYIRTAEGLNDNNKIVIQLPRQGSILNIQARSISPKGIVKELNKDNIKEMKDFDQGGNLKVFAIEGATVGGQIEYSYSIQTPLYDSGKELLSMDYKTVSATVTIKCYLYYRISSKALNWKNKIFTDQTENKYVFNNILPISEEKYATPRANRVSVEHKLLGNQAYHTTYSSYKSVFNKKQKEFYIFPSSEHRRVGKVLKSFKKSDNEEETIRNLAVYLKKKIKYVEDYSKASYSDIKAISKSGIANDPGIIKFYCVALRYLNIDFEVWITGNKYQNRLDPEYCSRNSLDEFVLYFPKYDSYLYPASQYTHYGIAPSWIVGNTALVISRNGNSVFFKEVRDRKPEFNMTNLKIDVNLNLDDNSSVFDIKGFGTGQLAASYNRSMYYSESEGEKKKELESLISWRYPDAEIVDMKMVSPEKWGDISYCKDYECKREYTAKVKSSSFYDKAGSKLLVKVGDLLGPQVELYSALERIQPITTAYNKSYSFDITIPIPEGYSFGGKQNTEINNELIDEEGNKLAGFSSSLTVEGSKVTIKVYEYYNEINIDKKYYDTYRKVINSAADFNKAVVLLTKNK